MNKIYFTVLVALLLPLGCYSSTELSGQLPNGVNYSVSPAIEEGPAKVRLIVNVGTQDEAWNERGFSILMQRMLWHKTKVSEHETIYEYSVSSAKPKSIKSALELFAGRLQEPQLQEAQFERTRLRLLEELMDVVDGLKGLETVQGLVGLPMLASVQQSELADLEEFAAEHYRPENMKIEVEGALNPVAAKAHITKAFYLDAAPEATGLAQTLWDWEPSVRGGVGIKNNSAGFGGRRVQGVPNSPLVRVLTGDVKPEWISGLGRGAYKDGSFVPNKGYNDVFVSSLAEYARIGIVFDFAGFNDALNVADKLALADWDRKKCKEHGIWVLIMNPGRPLATPTGRRTEWNPHYKEGGATAGGVLEWVTVNSGVHEELNAGQMQLYRIHPDGSTQEYRSWRGQLMSAEEKMEAIEAHLSSRPKLID